MYYSVKRNYVTESSFCSTFQAHQSIILGDYQGVNANVAANGAYQPLCSGQTPSRQGRRARPASPNGRGRSCRTVHAGACGTTCQSRRPTRQVSRTSHRTREVPRTLPRRSLPTKRASAIWTYAGNVRTLCISVANMTRFCTMACTARGR